MSYFNHAYRKSFVGTKATQAGSGTAKAVNNGFLTDTGVPTSALADTAAPFALGVGTYGFFNPDTYLSVNAASAEVIAGKPLVFAAAALFTNDKIGPFHGGYKESNKSKMINPRFVHKFTKMTGAATEQSIWHLGNTNYNADAIATLGALTAGTGYTNGTYTNVALVSTVGAGALATVVVAGGVVTSITITSPGQGYAVGTVLTLPASVPFVAGTPASSLVATIKYNTAGSSVCSFDFVCGETYNLRCSWGCCNKYYNYISWSRLCCWYCFNITCFCSFCCWYSCIKFSCYN
jgi:hypothetical protein